MVFLRASIKRCGGIFGARRPDSGLCSLQSGDTCGRGLFTDLWQFGAALQTQRPPSSAEQLLLYAIALNDDADIALRSCISCWYPRSRIRGLEVRGDSAGKTGKGSYYWLGVGLDHLQRGNYPKASTLSSMRRTDHGFQEVHRYLAIAYWRPASRRVRRINSRCWRHWPLTIRRLPALRRKIE